MSESPAKESKLAKLRGMRINGRPWQVVVGIGGLGVLLVGLLAFSLKSKTDEAAVFVRQMSATHQIQHLSTDLLLRWEGVSHPEHQPGPAGDGPLPEIFRYCDALLEGGKVGRYDIDPVDGPLQAEAQCLKNAAVEFRRAHDELVGLAPGSPAETEAEEVFHESHLSLVGEARELHRSLRREVNHIDEAFKAQLVALLGLSLLLILLVAVLLSEKTRRRLVDLMGVRETLERYDAVFEEAPLGYHCLDGRGRIIAVNRAWTEELGYSRDDALGKWFGDFLQPDGAEYFKERFEQFKSEGIIEGVEMPMERADGTHVTMAFDGRVELDDQGRFVRTHCVMKDITERLAAERALKTRERQQAVVAEMGKVALACTELQELLDLGVMAVTETLDVYFTHVLELLPDGKSVRIPAGIGWDDELKPEVELALHPSSMGGYALRQAEPVVVKDLKSDSRFDRPGFLIERGMTSSICSIIGTPDHPFGVLSAHSRDFREFTQDEANFIHSVANLIAAAMTRLEREERIRHSESQLRSLFEHAPVSIGKQDMSALFAYFEQLRGQGVKDFRDHFDRNPSDVDHAATLVRTLDINQTCMDLHEVESKAELLVSLDKELTPRAKEMYLEELVALAEGERAFKHISEVRTPSGKHKEVIIELIVDPTCPDGSLVYVVNVDLSEIRRTEEALGRSETLLRTLFDTAEDCMFLKDRDGHYTLVNRAMMEMFGKSAESLVGLTDLELFGAEPAARINESDRRVLAGETVSTMDPEPVDGEFHTFHVIKVPMKDAEGNISGIFGIARDVTESVEAAKELSSRESQIRALVNAANDIIFMKDRDRRYTVVNPAFERRLDLSRSEILGKSLDELYPDENDTDLKDLEDRVFAGEIVHSDHEYVIDGRWICYSVVRVPVRNKDGEIEGLCGVSRDITESVESARALAQSENLLRTFIDTAKDAMFIKDTEGRFTLANNALADLLDMREDEILMKTSAEIFGEDLGEAIYEDDRRVLDGEQIKTLEAKMVRGEARQLDVVKVPMRDEAGRVTGICGIARDITDEVEAAQALAKSEARFRTLVESARDIIYIKDRERRFTMVNPAMCEVEGMSADEILGKTNTEAFGNQADEILDDIDMRILAGETISMEYENETKDGMRMLNVMRVPLRDSEGEIEGIVGIARDVSEHHAVKEEILRLATAIEQAGDAVVVTDREGIIQYVNPAFETSSGYTRSEMLGKVPDFLEVGKRDGRLDEEPWNTILGGEVWSGRFINKRKDGTLLHETATISPVFDREGEITHFVAVKHDITRQIELEEQVRHAHRMEAVGHLAGGLAHDFNNILQSMIGFLEFAREGLEEDDQRRLDLEEVQKGANRATKLTQELLTFSRLREAKLVPLDLRAAFGASLSMMRPMLGMDIYLEFSEPDEPLVAMVDHLLLDRVITNLCVNARDAMPEGGELRIELKRREIDETFASLHTELSPGPHVCFSIADSGKGIPPERLGHIFDPFYSTKDIGEGTGLGLAVVHGIVKQHGGLIEVESEMGKGTRFLVTLQEARAEEIREHELAEKAHH